MSRKIAAGSLALLMLAQVLFLSAPAANINITVTAFGDGSKEKELTFPAAGSLSTANISLQTGLIIDNATFKVTASPLAGPGRSHPYNITIDVGDDGDPEWEFRGPEFGEMGHQTNFSTGKNHINISLPQNGGSNSTASIRLPKSATVTSAAMNITNIRGGGGSMTVAIETQLNSAAMNAVNNDPVYSIQSLCQAQGWTAKIVSGTDIDTLAELQQYAVVVTGDSGHGDRDWTTYQNQLLPWVQAGGGFVGIGWFVYYGITGTAMDTILPVNGQGGGYESGGNLAVVNANHEIMTGVAAFPIQSYCDYPVGGIDNGAVTLMNTPGGRPTVVSGNCGNGRSVYIGPIAFGCFQTYSSANYYSDNSFKNLLANSLRWCAGKLTLNCSLDVGNDGTVEWKNESMNGSEAVPDMASQLNSYLAAATPNGTDVYGNQYVDVPIAVSSNTSGMVRLENLSITYDYTATVDLNPAFGNLTNKLNDLLADDIGSGNVSIPIKVTTETAGKIKLFNLNIKAHPPGHLPTLVSVTPTGDTQIFENSSLDMDVTASDIYGNPLTYQWFRNGTAVNGAKNTTYKFTSDFETSGKHTVKVVIDNGLGNISWLWNITVKNVNRPPAVDTFFPPGDTTIKENASLEFRVNGTDPDRDLLRYAWFVNGNERLGVSTNYMLFTTDFSSSGVYDVRAQVMDPGGLSVNKTWKLSVSNVNVPPKIDAYNPRTNPKIRELETVTFSVMASDYDKQPLTYKWFLNDTEMTSTTQYTYRSDYDSAGNYTVRVVVSDGELTDTHQWSLTVDNVNRMPIPIIGSPKDPLEFMNTEAVKFSAKSSKDPDGDIVKFKWLEAGKELSTASEFEMLFAAGEHDIGLEVTDGNGGFNSTTVHFKIHFIEITGSVEVDKTSLTQDDIVTVTATINNMGDVPANSLTLEFLVDNKSVETKNLASVDAGGAEQMSFTWKTGKGSHTLSVRVDNQTWSKSIDVKPKALGIVGSDSAGWLFPLIIVLVICAAVGTGAYADARKKKKKRMEAEQQAFPAPGSATAPPYAQAPASVPATQQYSPPTPQYGTAQPGVYSQTPPAAGAPAAPAPYAPIVNPAYGQTASAPYTPVVNPAYGQTPPAPQPQAAAPAYGQQAPYTPVQAGASAPAMGAGGASSGAGYGAAGVASVGAGAAATAAIAAAPADDEDKRMQKKALKIITQVTELVQSIEAGGIEVDDSRRALDLAKSFVKANNPTKAIQYAKKADSLAREKRERVKAQKAGSPVCGSCGAAAQPGWKACPKCGSKM